MDWLSFFGSVLGGLIGGIFTFLGVKLTIKHEKNSQEKEMLKNTFEKKPRLEILSVRHYETNMGYISRSHIDIKALFLVIKEVTLNDRPSVYYDEAALKEENLVFFEFEMKNTGLTEIEDICITSNNPQRVAVFNKEKREFYINKHRLNYDCDIILDNEWVNEGIRIISKFISDNKLSNVGDFLYDEAKYFHSAFEYYAEEEYSHNDTYLQNYKDEFGLGKFLCSTDGSKKGFLSFRNYFQAYMDKVTIQKDFEAIPPIAYLINVEDFYSCDKKNLCYWIMEMLSVISAYIINTTNKKWILCKGDASPETFEDRYYDVLINLFNLSKSKKSKDF